VIGTTDQKLALETFGLIKSFGGIVATDDASLKVAHGARHALIGPNGAGKTTLINLLTGVLSPTAGRIQLNGEDITQLSSESRVKRGLARTFQINQLFPAISPLEALMLVISERRGLGWKLFRKASANSEVLNEALEIAENLRLSDILNETTSSLPYGKQRQLEIALAIACRPKVLLLDEPAAGVPEVERDDLLSTIAELPKDVTVLLVEHDMDIVFRFADRISVLVNGSIFAEGSPAEMAADPRVKAVYLGEGHSIDHATDSSDG
jgi:ABC-type branched-subunit amino acid transport system ATPase component